MSIERLLQLTTPEVKAAIEQICDEAGTSDADWQILKAAGELLAAAKAASAVPVKINELCADGYVGKLAAWCENAESAKRLHDWLRERMKGGEG